MKRKRHTRPWPRLSVKQILAWADAYHARRGRWPLRSSGRIADSLGETWLAVNTALIRGSRGLPGGTSLAQLLKARRGVRNRKDLPLLSEKRILSWADAHHRKTKQWPHFWTGLIPASNGETWHAVDAALRNGQRGIAGASSLARLLAKRRGVRNHMDLPRLTQTQILTWVDAYRKSTGRWPNRKSGPVRGANGETWCGVDVALKKGNRKLKSGNSLSRLLKRHRGVKGKANHYGQA